jgi:hypothetical protein
MANILTAGNSSNGGTAISTDTSGTLNIVTGSGSGANAITIDASQNVSISGNNLVVSASSGVGYGTGAGGTVTQTTNKGTTVTINKPVGQITTSNAALAGGAEAGFVVSNSFVSATDIVLATNQNGNYLATAYAVASGQFAMRLRNLTVGSLSDAVVINFVVIKGVNA